MRSKPAIDFMAQDDQLDSATLDVADWQNLKDIMQVLEPFKILQMFEEADKYLTSTWALPAIRNFSVKLAKFATAQEESASKIFASNLLQNLKSGGSISKFHSFLPQLDVGTETDK